MKTLVLRLLVLIAFLVRARGHVSQANGKHERRLQTNKAKESEKATTSLVNSGSKSPTNQIPRVNVGNATYSSTLARTRHHSNGGLQLKTWPNHNTTTTSNKRQNVVSFSGDPSQQRLYHVDETGTLHRHEVGPEEFSTPEGKTATFSNDKGLTEESLSNLRPSQGGPTEPSTRQVLTPSGMNVEQTPPSLMPPYPLYSVKPVVDPGYQPVAFTSPPVSFEHHPYHDLMPYPSKEETLPVPRLPHVSYVVPLPVPRLHHEPYPVPVTKIHHVPYPVPVTRIRHVPYPVAVPIRQPPVMKPVPVPVAVPYPVASPPTIRNVPYPVAVPVRSPPVIHKVPVPVPVPQIRPMPYPHMYPLPFPAMRPMPVAPMTKGIVFPKPIIPMPVGLSECSTNPCRNGGTCYAVEDTYKCHCSTGFKGRHCEETSKCHPNPCENFGECTVLQDGYECSCKKGFRGSRCEVRDQCHPNPCRSGGSCTSVGNEYACSCIYGFIGKDCEVESKCFPLNPCKHGGTCHEYSGDYKCTCTPGWDGMSCEIPDPCSRNPCYHGGVCSALGSAYTCACQAGYLGKTCEIESQCHSSRPCQNGGTCREHGVEGYKCFCNGKWNGDNCEIPSYSMY